MKTKLSAIMLMFGLVLSSCTGQISNNTLNLMDGIKKSDISPIEISGVENIQANKRIEITDLSLKLLRESFDDKNILISPLSIVSALGMLANGAKGNTLAEMNRGLNSDTQSLNDFIKAYTAYLPSGDKYTVSIANSIWFKNDENLTVNNDFLQTNKDYYDADVYKSPFDDSTKNDINNWVNVKTDGMIKKLLDQAPPDNAMMYLINALSFDAEWAKIYEDKQVRDGEFTTENGAKQTARFMNSIEYQYVENDMATGFIKPYKDSKYAFVALLPKANIAMSNFLESLEAKSLTELNQNKEGKTVYAKLPKFSAEYNTLLNEPLQSLGMTDAFDEQKADFSGLGKSLDGNIFISRVIHKTKIDVDEKGTKAGAVTSVEMVTGSAMQEDPKKVILDRPFFCMIIDTEQGIPLFMGSLMSLK